MNLNDPNISLHIFYRISDKGESKERMNLINNFNCLKNFLIEFPTSRIEIIADNVNDETFNWLNSFKFKNIHRTSLGNSGSFWFAYQLAIKLPDNNYVYFVENDYIHRPNSLKVLLEGLQLADYVSLYDHPDKYMKRVNPRVKDGAEKSKIYLSENSHWKVTNSTTMTFASRIGTLKHDRNIFKLFTIGIIRNGFPILKMLQYRKIPADYRIFSALSTLQSRKVICPIQGYSTHGETRFLSPLIDWQQFLNTSSEEK